MGTSPGPGSVTHWLRPQQALEDGSPLIGRLLSETMVFAGNSPQSRKATGGLWEGADRLAPPKPPKFVVIKNRSPSRPIAMTELLLERSQTQNWQREARRQGARKTHILH